MNPARENPIETRLENAISSRFSLAAALREKTAALRYRAAAGVLSLGRTFFLSESGEVSNERKTPNDRKAGMFLGRHDNSLKFQFVECALQGLGVGYGRMDEEYKPWGNFAPDYKQSAVIFVLANPK